MPKLYNLPHKARHEDGGVDEISITGLSGLVGDSQTPLAHKTSHQDGGTDELTVAGLAGQQIFVPYNGKIADITHADTNKHTLDLAAALGETRKIIWVNLVCNRMAGTGFLDTYPNEGAMNAGLGSDNRFSSVVAIKNGTQRLQYKLDTVNDDFDLYCLGYVVEA